MSDTMEDNGLVLVLLVVSYPASYRNKIIDRRANQMNLNAGPGLLRLTVGDLPELVLNKMCRLRSLHCCQHIFRSSVRVVVSDRCGRNKPPHRYHRHQSYYNWLTLVQCRSPASCASATLMVSHRTMTSLITGICRRKLFQNFLYNKLLYSISFK